MREVEARSRDVVLGLTDVHPEAGKVVGVQLLVGSDRGEDLLLDRGRAELNAVKNRRVEHVDTGVDAVSDELDGLLNEAVNNRRARLGDDNTVGGRLSDLGNLRESVIRSPTDPGA